MTNIRDRRCNYCSKFSASYWCENCHVKVFCGKGCYKLDKMHHEKCPYLISQPSTLKMIPAKTFKELFGRVLSFLLYHWHRNYGVGYAECIIISSNTKSNEFRVIFDKDISKLGNEYTNGMLNFAASEITDEVLEEQGVSLRTGEMIIGNPTDLSGFEVGVYPTPKACDHYYYFSKKIDVHSIGTQVFGLQHNNKIGIYCDSDKVIYLS